MKINVKFNEQAFEKKRIEKVNILNVFQIRLQLKTIATVLIKLLIINFFRWPLHYYSNKRDVY